MNIIAMQSSLTYMLITEDNENVSKSFETIEEYLSFKERINNTDEKKYINLFLEDVIKNTDNAFSISDFDTLNSVLDVERIGNQIYLKNIKAKVCLPPSFIETVIQNKDDEDKISRLRNFWVRASNNPDVHITNRIFEFLTNCGMHLLPNGCFVAYRGNVEKSSNIDSDLSIDRLNKFIEIIKSRKKGLSSYVYDKYTDSILPTTDERMSQGCYLTIAEWQNRLVNNVEETRFTDKHTGTMDIRLGSVVAIDRKLCDNDPNIECSNGLTCSPVV